jgi:methylated-DNA-[protein]-cysteine S-methyltransferase
MKVRMDSPIGTLEIEARDGAITAIEFVEGTPTSTDDPLLLEAVDQLVQYFEGNRDRFELPLAPKGTEFQRRVWAELERIPLGTTISYGDPGASRAVGAANGKNPIAVVIPCHRVVGADGSLTGYAGGVDRKEALLRREGGVQYLRDSPPVRSVCTPSSPLRPSSIPS